ncbi:MAG: hypothetical protein R3332_06000 [Pseudohongiellaceae bacterium]|nr:hypothetical protein [Pseudohongiellaceae bacterium]
MNSVNSLTKKVVLFLCCLFFLNTSLLAEDFIDQQFQANSSPGMYSGVGSADFAQTFTVSRSGVLIAVEFEIQRASGNEDDLFFDLRDVDGELPVESNSSVVYSERISAQNIPENRTFYRVDLGDSAFAVEAGETFAIVLRSNGWRRDGLVDYWWLGQSWSNSKPDQYVHGNAFVRADFRTDLPYSNTDRWGHVNFYSDDTRGAGDLGFRTYLSVELSPPSADILNGNFTVADSNGIGGEVVSLEAAATDSDGYIVSTTWLQDGEIVATGLSVQLALPDGETDIVFRAVDNDGKVAESSVVVSVQAPVINSAPIVAILGGDRIVADSDGVIGEVLQFTANATDSDGTVVSSSWFIGDELVAVGSSVSLVLNDGVTLVEYRAIDDEGGVAITYASITIEAPVTKEGGWSTSFNGIAPPSFLANNINNIGVVDIQNLVISSCVTLVDAGEPVLFDGYNEFDMVFGLVSAEELTFRLERFRPFNLDGSRTNDNEIPDCSGHFDFSTGIYLDSIAFPSISGDGLLSYDYLKITFEIINASEIVFQITSIESLR